MNTLKKLARKVESEVETSKEDGKETERKAEEEETSTNEELLQLFSKYQMERYFSGNIAIRARYC